VLILRLTIALLASGAFLTAGQRSTCGIRFTQPQGWTRTSERTDSNNCYVRLVPPGWAETRRSSDVMLPRYPVELRVTTTDRAVVAGDLGMQRVGDARGEGESTRATLNDDDWLVCGKACAPAQRVAGRTWKGVLGEAAVWVGFSDSTLGGHTSGVEYRALLMPTGDSRLTVVGTCSAVECDRTFRSLIQSVEFVRR
jgi:hypothetical protein